MATALAEGMLRAGLAQPSAIAAADPSPEACALFHDRCRAELLESNHAVVRQADTIVLAVKPQMMRAVLEELRGEIRRDHLVISVAAGVSIATMTEILGGDRRVIRVMSNTPALIGKGASAYAVGSCATEQDESLVRKLLEGVGIAIRLPEDHLDAVTGLSGSGPAFIYLVIEALADGGVRAGLARDVAMALALQTVLGAAAMVQQTGQHPGALKDQVASPGGTTIAGLHELERKGVRGAFMDAVSAAARRSEELAHQAEAQRSPRPPRHRH